MLEKCVLTILELNWNQRLGHRKTKLNICHHMLTSSTQLQNRSFHVVERTRMSTKCEKNEKCTCKACKNTVFHCQLCKFVGFLLPLSSWLLKLSTNFRRQISLPFLMESSSNQNGDSDRSATNLHTNHKAYCKISTGLN